MREWWVMVGEGVENPNHPNTLTTPWGWWGAVGVVGWW